MKFSVRTRIVVVITVVVATVLLGFGAYGLQRTYSDLRARQDLDVSTTAERLANELWILVHDYNREQIDRAIETAMRNRSIVVVIVRDALGDTVISGKTRTPDWAVTDLRVDEDISPYARRTVAIVQQGTQVGTVEIRFTDKFMKQEVMALARRQAGEIIVLLVILILALMLAISSNVLRPLKALQATFKSISNGNLEQEIDTSRGDEIGSLARSFASLRDSIREKITDLSTSDELLRTTLNSTADGVLVVSNEGKVLISNPQFGRMWHIPEEALEKTDEDANLIDFVLDKLADPEAFSAEVAGLYQTTDESLDEIRMKDGRVFERYTCPLIQDGIPTGRLWSFRDISDRKHAEEERHRIEVEYRQAQKMEAIGQLAGGVAHDFNNLLQGIHGYTELSLADLPKNHSVRGNLIEVKNAAERAASLTRQLLTFSRRETLQPRNLDINEIIAGLAKMLSRLIGEQIELVVHIDPSLRPIHADRGQIEQILMNLCINARDAMPGGGTLKIEAKNTTLGDDYSQRHLLARAGDYVSIAVIDDGKGMSPDVQERMFEPFFTTKGVGEGTGLGLATVYAIVQRWEGMIDVESAPDQGTTLTMYLPVSSQAIPGETVPITPASAEGGNEVILLAEDESLVRNLAVKILTNAGYNLVVAENGEEAVRAFVQDPAQFDLVLLDVVMPKMSGRAVHDSIKATRPDLPVIFCSGYSFDTIQKEYLPAEKVELIQKPYTAQDLLKKIRETLNRSKLRNQPPQ